MNTASLSRISTTINGTAELIPFGSEQESWYKAQHLANNTFGRSEEGELSGLVGAGAFSSDRDVRTSPTNEHDVGEGDGGRKYYVEDDQVRVVVVRVTDGRIADWKGQTRDWVVAAESRSARLNGE
jgi:hypothetical protein